MKSFESALLRKDSTLTIRSVSQSLINKDSDATVTGMLSVTRKEAALQ